MKWTTIPLLILVLVQLFINPACGKKAPPIPRDQVLEKEQKQKEKEAQTSPATKKEAVTNQGDTRK